MAAPMPPWPPPERPPPSSYPEQRAAWEAEKTAQGDPDGQAAKQAWQKWVGQEDLYKQDFVASGGDPNKIPRPDGQGYYSGAQDQGGPGFSQWLQNDVPNIQQSAVGRLVQEGHLTPVGNGTYYHSKSGGGANSADAALYDSYGRPLNGAAAQEVNSFVASKYPGGTGAPQVGIGGTPPNGAAFGGQPIGGSSSSSSLGGLDPGQYNLDNSTSGLMTELARQVRQDTLTKQFEFQRASDKYGESLPMEQYLNDFYGNILGVHFNPATANLSGYLGQQNDLGTSSPYSTALNAGNPGNGGTNAGAGGMQTYGGGTQGGNSATDTGFPGVGNNPFSGNPNVTYPGQYPDLYGPPWPYDPYNGTPGSSPPLINPNSDQSTPPGFGPKAFRSVRPQVASEMDPALGGQPMSGQDIQSDQPLGYPTDPLPIDNPTLGLPTGSGGTGQDVTGGPHYGQGTGQTYIDPSTGNTIVTDASGNTIATYPNGNYLGNGTPASGIGAPPAYTGGSYNLLSNSFNPNNPQSWALLAKPASSIAGNLTSNLRTLRDTLPMGGGEYARSAGQAINQSYGNIAGLKQGQVNDALGYFKNTAASNKFGAPIGSSSGAAGTTASILGNDQSYSLGLQKLAADQSNNSSAFWGNVLKAVGTYAALA